MKMIVECGVDFCTGVSQAFGGNRGEHQKSIKELNAEVQIKDGQIERLRSIVDGLTAENKSLQSEP